MLRGGQGGEDGVRDAVDDGGVAEGGHLGGQEAPVERGRVGRQVDEAVGQLHVHLGRDSIVGSVTEFTEVPPGYPTHRQRTSL